MKMKVALLGNPNCGKTTMFNELTGSSQHVGNWPGVTVERKEGKLKWDQETTIVDLPGIYSLSPYSPEEIVSRDFIMSGEPNVVVNIVDATNLERNLYLTTQVLETGVPVVVALNMMDIISKKGIKIDTKKLSEEIGCPVVETSALKKIGLKELMQEANSIVGKTQIPRMKYSEGVENALRDISKNAENISRWTAVKLLEKDEVEVNKFGADLFKKEILPIVSKLEDAEDDDSESIITNERYNYIEKIVSKSSETKKSSEKLTLSDKVDNIVTNRWLGIPIFIGIMWLIYYIAVETIGSQATGWANDVLIGEWILGNLEAWLASVGASDIVTGLLIDGVVGGFGAVIGFLPQMIVLFILLAILEGCGYMARIAFVMDRLFRRFGLSGKSAIPAMIGLGCGIPAVTASRSIETQRERKITAMTTTFMPCSAKLPVIALIVGALFGGNALVAASFYLIGILSILIAGLILKKFKGFTGEPSPFILELPPYRIPGIKGVAFKTGERAWSFVKRAGTIIVISAVAIWFLSRFDWTLTYLEPEQIGNSMLAGIGSALSVLFVPLGWAENWEFSVATITGLVAKENVVGTLGVLFGFSEVSEAGEEIWALIGGMLTPIAGYSFLLFNMLCAPCFAAIGAMNTELGGRKNTLIAVGFQTLFAYAAALIFYQIALLFTGNVELWIILAIATIGLIAYILISKHPFEKGVFKA